MTANRRIHGLPELSSIPTILTPITGLGVSGTAYPLTLRGHPEFGRERCHHGPVGIEGTPAATAADGTTEWPRKRFVLAMAAITFAQGIATFDNAGIGTLARPIQFDLGTTLTAVQYGITGQLLFGAAFVLVASRFGDLFGRTRMLVIGLSLRLIGSIVTATAPNAFIFFLGRAVLGGIGTALALVSGLAIMGIVFIGATRVRASAMLVATTAAMTIAAPLLAGAFASTIGWRWFYVTCTALLAIGLAFTRLTPKVGPSAKSEKIDVIGALLAITALGCVVFGIQQTTQWGLISPRQSPFTIAGMSPVLFIIGLGLLLLVGFTWFEHTRRLAGHAVLFDIRLLRDRFVRTANLAVIGLSSLLFGVMFLVPVYLQIVEGLTPFQSGLRVIFYGLGALTMSMFTSRLSHRLPLRGIFTIAISAAIVSLFLLAWEMSPLPFGATPVGLFILGITLALSKGPLNVSTQRSVTADRRSQVGAVGESAWAMGGALGIAIIGTLLLASLSFGVQRLVVDDANVSPTARAITKSYLDSGLPFVSESRVRTVLGENGLDSQEIETLTDRYTTAADTALLLSLGGALLIALVTFGFIRRLPRKDPNADTDPPSMVDAASVGADP